MPRYAQPCHAPRPSCTLPFFCASTPINRVTFYPSTPIARHFLSPVRLPPLSPFFPPPRLPWIERLTASLTPHVGLEGLTCLRVTEESPDLHLPGWSAAAPMLNRCQDSSFGERPRRHLPIPFFWSLHTPHVPQLCRSSPEHLPSITVVTRHAPPHRHRCEIVLHTMPGARAVPYRCSPQRLLGHWCPTAPPSVALPWALRPHTVH
jgi:hypothetical protein